MAVLGSLDRLLQTRSIAEVTVEGIAEGAGMSRSAFYFYFASKHDALAAAVRTINDAMLERGQPWLNPVPGTDPGQALQRSFAGIAEVFEEHRHLISAVAEGAAIDPGLRELWQQWIEDFVGAVAPRIEAERAAGRALPGPEAEALARTLLWGNERAFYIEAIKPEPDLQGVAAIIATVWQRAIYGSAV
jgi:AcrR family transcriptional regulator